MPRPWMTRRGHNRGPRADEQHLLWARQALGCHPSTRPQSSSNSNADGQRVSRGSGGSRASGAVGRRRFLVLARVLVVAAVTQPLHNPAVDAGDLDVWRDLRVGHRATVLNL